MIFCMEINIKVFYSLVLLFLLVIAIHAQSTQNIKLFCMLININLSYKLRPLIVVGMAKPVQITQSNKFAKSFQYLKKEVRGEVDFLCRWVTVIYKLVLSLLMGR